MQWQLPIKGFFREFKSVRISEPWGKSAPCKIFDILLWLEISKIDHSIVVGWDGGWGRWGWDCKSPCPQVNVPFYFTKCPFIPRITLLFSRITFLFSNIALLFPGINLLFSRSTFLFLRNTLLFPRIAL